MALVRRDPARSGLPSIFILLIICRPFSPTWTAYLSSSDYIAATDTLQYIMTLLRLLCIVRLHQTKIVRTLSLATRAVMLSSKSFVPIGPTFSIHFLTFIFRCFARVFCNTCYYMRKEVYTAILTRPLLNPSATGCTRTPFESSCCCRHRVRSAGWRARHQDVWHTPSLLSVDDGREPWSPDPWKYYIKRCRGPARAGS